jgi:hypothetical protein
VSIKKTEALGDSGASNNKKIVLAFVTGEEPRFMTVFSWFLVALSMYLLVELLI